MTELQTIRDKIKYWKENIRLLKQSPVEWNKIKHRSEDCDFCEHSYCYNNCPAFKYTGKKCTSSGWNDFDVFLYHEDLEGCIKSANKLLNWLKEAETNCKKERQDDRITGNTRQY